MKQTVMYAVKKFIDYEQRDRFMYVEHDPRTTKLYEDKSPIQKVLVTESEHGDYFAWWDNEDQRFEYVYPIAGLVDVCFAYGTDAEEARGRGKLMSVTVVEC